MNGRAVARFIISNYFRKISSAKRVVIFHFMYLFYILFPYFQIINCARNITLRKTPKKEASEETFGKIFAAVEQEEEEVEVENNKIIKK